MDIALLLNPDTTQEEPTRIEATIRNGPLTTADTTQDEPPRTEDMIQNEPFRIEATIRKRAPRTDDTIQVERPETEHSAQDGPPRTESTTQRGESSSSRKRVAWPDDPVEDDSNKRFALEDASEPPNSHAGPDPDLTSVTLSLRPCIAGEWRMELHDRDKIVRLPCNALRDSFTLRRALTENFAAAKQVNLHVRIRDHLHDVHAEFKDADPHDIKLCLEMLLMIRYDYAFGFRFVTKDDMQAAGAVNRHLASTFRVVAWFYEVAKRHKLLNVDPFYPSSTQKNDSTKAGKAGAKVDAVTFSIKVPFKDCEYPVSLSDNDHAIQLTKDVIDNYLKFSDYLYHHFPGQEQLNVHVHLRKQQVSDDAAAKFNDIEAFRKDTKPMPKPKAHVHLSGQNFLGDDGGDVDDGRACLKMMLNVKSKHVFGFRFIADDDTVRDATSVNLLNASKFRIVSWLYEFAGDQSLDIDFEH